MPDGVQKRFAGPTAGPKADLTIHSQDAVYRILSDGKNGLLRGVYGWAGQF